MISAQALRVCREGKPLHAFPDHAPAQSYIARFEPRGKRPCTVIKRNDPPKRYRLGGSSCVPGSPRAPGHLTLLGGSRLGSGRNLGDRLQDLRGDLVGVALRVRTTVFQVALVAVVHEGVRHADRSATVGQTI